MTNVSDLGLSLDLLVPVFKLMPKERIKFAPSGAMFFVVEVIEFDRFVHAINPVVNLWARDEVESPYDLDFIRREVLWLEDKPVVDFPHELVELLFAPIVFFWHRNFEFDIGGVLTSPASVWVWSAWSSSSMVGTGIGGRSSWHSSFVVRVFQLERDVGFVVQWGRSFLGRLLTFCFSLELFDFLSQRSGRLFGECRQFVLKFFDPLLSFIEFGSHILLDSSETI